MEKEIDVLSINELLNLNLTIPKYQRPYEWTFESVLALLQDILESTNKPNYKYRIGTIILHNNDNKLDIVDGQQRIITLLLIKIILENNNDYQLLKEEFSNKITLLTIINNYNYINNWFNSKSKETKEKIKESLKNSIEILVIKVNKLNEAFQLFDSQNSRGKPLNPHDLLKSFHLREMKARNENKEAIRNTVNKWEKYENSDLVNLFSNYLYPITKWIKKENFTKFTNKKIDTFKGITVTLEKEEYSYTNIKKNYYQLGHPFYSGIGFFNMVNNYINIINKIYEFFSNSNNPKINYISNIVFTCLKKDFTFIKNKYNNNSDLVNNVLENSTIGFKYICRLFMACLICYYDRFNQLNESVIIKLFTWSFLLRIDLEMVNMKSISKYAISSNDQIIKYTNNIPMFHRIYTSINHYEIENLMITIPKKIEKQKYSKLLDLIYILNEKSDIYE